MFKRVRKNFLFSHEKIIGTYKIVRYFISEYYLTEIESLSLSLSLFSEQSLFENIDQVFKLKENAIVSNSQFFDKRNPYSVRS